MKKLLSLILATCMLFTLAACGAKENTTPTGTPAIDTTDPTTTGTPAVEKTSYTYTFEGMMGQETAQIDLYTDGTCQFFLPGNPMITDVYAGTYTAEGNVVKIFDLKNVDTSSAYVTPGLWDWIVDGNATITISEEGTFVPAGAASVEAGTYTYTETNDFGLEIVWTLVLKEDGTYTLSESNALMGDVSYEGTTWTSSGNTVTCGAMVEGPAIYAWANPAGFRATIDGESFMPITASGDDQTDTDEMKNVSYASNSDAQVCDIYLPEDGENWPVIVLVHGGGFLFGDQGMDVIQPVITKALEKGYAVVSVDYRKSTESLFPGAVADVKAAVRFVKAHAMEYGWNGERIALWGESAGAYLSLMTALTPNVEELNGDVTDYGIIDSQVQALVSFYAPVQWYTMYEEAGKPESAATSFESKFLGTDIMADKELTDTTYWETYADQIPTQLKAWIQAGDSDQKVPYTQSVNFAQRLATYIGEENVEHSIIKGADHEDDLFYNEENLNAVFAWLDGFMK